jgi:AcrR family transcriptional regulator
LSAPLNVGKLRRVPDTAIPRRRRLSRPERRELLLDAAELVFGEHGFHAASMDDVARATGVTKALIYEHFASKEQLYETCVERARERMFTKIAEGIAGLDRPVDQLRAFVAIYFDELQRQRHRWWLMYGEASPTAANAMRARNAAMIAPLLARAAEHAGAHPEPVDVELVSHTLVGAGEQVGRWWVARPEIPKAEVVERFTRACAGAIASLTPDAAR